MGSFITVWLTAAEPSLTKGDEAASRKTQGSGDSHGSIPWVGARPFKEHEAGQPSPGGQDFRP